MMTLNGPGSPVIMTLDVDWCPDWMIAEVAERLTRHGVAATFFATHWSPLIAELAGDSHFEIGIHPNFLPGSSHGASPDEVLDTMKAWFPQARVCRTHSLVQSEPLLAKMVNRYGIAIDASIHLPRAAYVTPHTLALEEAGPLLVRVPHVFQDNMHAIARRPWTVDGAGLHTPGWKSLNFHPVHVVANMSCLADYQALKQRGNLSQLTPRDLPIRETQGAGALFDDLLALLQGGATWTLSGAVAQWQAAAET